MTYKEVQRIFEVHHHVFFDDGEYNVNLFGIRKGYQVVDEFNDILGVAFRDENGNPVVIEHRATTKPGYYWLKKKLGNINGTAILVPDQYPLCWQLGEHSGYEALVQRGRPFHVWRDIDADGEFDVCGQVYKDVTGLNMHTTSWINEVDMVGAYSAGCQVRQYKADHIELMEVLRKSEDLYGNAFSYTLFEM
jgi:hypothetical protein